MKSSGNDIVALNTVNKKRTNQFRFYSKILSDQEQLLYQQPPFATMPFENYVWLLWSVKESAYKYLKRKIPDLLFSPTKIDISKIINPKEPLSAISEYTQWDNSWYDQELYSGEVIYGPHHFYFRSKISKDWIATVVNEDENFEHVCWGIQYIDDASHSYQSNAARVLLLKKLNLFIRGNLSVEKSANGCPVIIRDNQNMNIPVSLAHDGHFVAYSFIANPTANK